jgi:hypothetical protein
VVPNTRFLGFRVSFKPHPAWDIGLSRTAQWCGDGRPCDWDTFWDIVLGRNENGDDDADPQDDPSNQQAGIDIRVSNQWFGTPMAFYLSGTATDEAGGLPSAWMAHGGIESSGYFRNRWSYRWFLEFASNSCDALKSPVRFNCSYEHVIYETGYRYRGRVIGHAAEADARIGSGGIVFTNDKSTTWAFLFRYGDLNRDGLDVPFNPRNTLTPTPQEILSADIQFGTRTRFGRVEIGVGYEEIDDEASGIKSDDIRAFVSWRSP